MSSVIRRVALAAVAVVVAFLGIAAAAAPATAATPTQVSSLDWFCKPASPMPERPDAGVPSWFVEAPDTPPTGDPFDPASGVNIIDAYGLAGLTWPGAPDEASWGADALFGGGVGGRDGLSDKICGLGSKADVDGQTSTTFANWIMVVPIAFTGAVYALGNYAYNPDWLDFLDPVLLAVTSAVYEGVFSEMAPIMFLIAAACVAAAAHRAALSAAITTTLIGILAVTIAALAFGAPKWVTDQSDRILVTATTNISAGVGGVGGEVNGTASSAVAPVISNLMWSQWCAGMVGSADSAVAVKYCPDLYKASAYSWAEVKQMDADTSKVEPITKAKQKLWDDTAKAIRDESPSAYGYVLGQHGSNRIGAAAMSWFAVGFVLPFLLLAFLLMLVSYLLIRLLLMFAGVFALVMVIPKMHFVAKTLGVVIVASILNIVIFTAGVGIVIRVVGGIMSPDTQLAWFFKILLAGLVSWIAWSMLKPFRKLTSLMPGGDPVRDAIDAVPSPGRAIRRTAGRIGTAAVGSFIGNRAADVLDDSEEDREEAKRQEELPPEGRDRVDDVKIVPGMFSDYRAAGDAGHSTRDAGYVAPGTDSGASTTNPADRVYDPLGEPIAVSGPRTYTALPAAGAAHALPAGDAGQIVTTSPGAHVFIEVDPGAVTTSDAPTFVPNDGTRAPIELEVVTQGPAVGHVIDVSDDRTFDGQAQMPHSDAVAGPDGRDVFPVYSPIDGTVSYVSASSFADVADRRDQGADQ